MKTPRSQVVQPDPFARVRVTEHATKRFRERYPLDEADRIVGEVRSALLHSRYADRAPGRMRGDGDGGITIYAWTQLVDRVYVIRRGRRQLLVVTVLDPAHSGYDAPYAREQVA